MAGSYRHIVNHKNEFQGIGLIDNLGDALEALEECYYMIGVLSGWDKEKIRLAYLEYVKLVNGDVEYASKSDYWRDEE